MSKKYIDTSFRSFIKYKLNEITQTQSLEIDQQPNDSIQNAKKNKNEYKIGSKEYMAEMVREFEDILKGYDNL